MFFKCNISVKDRYACIYEQFIFLSSFVFAHLDTAQSRALTFQHELSQCHAIYIQVHLNKLECRGKIHLFQ